MVTKEWGFRKRGRILGFLFFHDNFWNNSNFWRKKGRVLKSTWQEISLKPINKYSSWREGDIIISFRIVWRSMEACSSRSTFIYIRNLKPKEKVNRTRNDKWECQKTYSYFVFHIIFTFPLVLHQSGRKQTTNKLKLCPKL